MTIMPANWMIQMDEFNCSLNNAVYMYFIYDINHLQDIKEIY